MRTIIFEGIATSGKTTVEQKLIKILGSKRVKFIDEFATLMPLIHNKDPKLAIEHLVRLISDLENNDADYIIIDRLHFTHIFRTNAEIENFSVFEESLNKLNPLIVLLKIQPNKIASRIAGAIKHRDSEWVSYVKSKGNSMDEITSYYSNQQNNLLKMIKNTKISSFVIDTSDEDYDEAAKKIYQLIAHDDHDMIRI